MSDPAIGDLAAQDSYDPWPQRKARALSLAAGEGELPESQTLKDFTDTGSNLAAGGAHSREEEPWADVRETERRKLDLPVSLAAPAAGIPVGSLAAQDSYDPFAAEQFVPPAAADWARQAAPQDVATLQAIAQPVMGALAAPGQALASTAPITSEQMIAPAAGIAGLTTLGAGAAPATANELRMGIKAYHGSPYDFDKFDLSKIGTGEGAQAYGHGLYFAEHEPVARQYRDALSQDKWTVGGQSADPLNPTHLAAATLQHYGSPQLAMKDLQISATQGPEVERQAARSAIDLIQSGTQLPKAVKSPGHMYEVDINADPAHFLDWDKPLMDQPKAVQDWAKKVSDSSYIAKKNFERPEPTGKDIWEKSRSPFAGKALGYSAFESAGPSQAMSQSGIPGIKYLDQGSRLPRSISDLETRIAKANEQLATWSKLPNDRTQPFMIKSLNDEIADLHGQLATAKAAPQTSNYVVFNPDIIKILRKYGLAGAAPAGMGALAAQDNYQQ